jgi:cytoskeletal protein RodZ
VILRRDAAPRRAADPADPTSVPDLARTLRQARLQRGLDLEEASAACGVPAGQLEDLEAGTVSRLPDRVAVLKDLRRYADSLDLPGERYVLVMVEHWPDDAIVTASVLAVGAGADGVAVASAPVATLAPETSSLFLVPDSLTSTAALEAQPAPATNGTPPWAAAPADGDANTDQVPLVLADTGVTPAVRAWRPRAGVGADSAVVEYLCGFVAVLLVISTAWLGVNHWRPEWLRAIHVPYTSKPLPLAAGAPPATTPTTAGSATATTAKPAATPTTKPPVTKTTKPPKSKSAKAPVKPTATTVAPRGLGTSGRALQLTSVAGDHATFAVRASTFVVRVHCVGGDAWVQVSGATPTPVFAQIVPANGTKDFQGKGTLTMVIGSSAARLTILHGKTVIGTYTPPSAPFSMTFSSSR